MSGLREASPAMGTTAPGAVMTETGYRGGATEHTGDDQTQRSDLMIAAIDPETRPEPPHAGSEREVLSGFLDYQRQTLIWKVSGISEEDLGRRLVPSATTLLGMVKHLAYVERWWFQAVFAGREMPFPWSDADPDADFRLEAGETAADIVALYQAEVAIAQQIVAAAASLEDIARIPSRDQSLRWIMVHMIEETARHCGHADILRELLDGATGE